MNATQQPRPALPPQLRTQAALAVDQFFGVLGVAVTNRTAHDALTDAMGRLMASAFHAGVEYSRKIDAPGFAGPTEPDTMDSANGPDYTKG
jgi:hypothetical protein